VAYRVEITKSAGSQIRKLSPPFQVRIVTKLRQLAENPRPQGVQKLKGADDLYRVRVGDFRILYEISDAAQQVLVTSVADRKDASR
jgi:mRNA interferase RelE/StbE